ncbi:E3 ubiquitin-protein ligase DCST1-like isoform X1 [Cimex lectularius]|uniref:Dendritic cell-specific transmembrane protein-like domain-containing protein n=2 Tax=Cimex lectularius TaxID=79782 RepID=A0A8I6S123_CIMLE|nr:E3 ubiquitin-protein ligase DCST1-like isoform X1 [Cimex lectularius]
MLNIVPMESLNSRMNYYNGENYFKARKKLKRACAKTCVSAFLNPVGIVGNILAGFIGLCLGIIIALWFYYIILSDLEFSTSTNMILSITFGVFLSLGCATSSQLRCITLLTFPSMCGKGGRGMLRAFLIAYLLAGPLANLMRNGKEIIRSFGCTSSMTYRINKLKHDLIYTPFYKTLMNLKGDMNEVQDAMVSLNAVVEPLTHEFRDEDEIGNLKEDNDYMDDLQKNQRRSVSIDNKYSLRKTRKNEDGIVSHEKIEEEYYRKLEYRCESIYTAAEANCRKIFDTSYDRCREAVSSVASWALCWPMKLTVVCNTAAIVGDEKNCDPKSEISSGWGYGYEYLIKAKKEMFKDFQHAEITYKIRKPNITLDLRTADDTAQAIMKEFERKKDFIDLVLLFIKRLMALAFIKIILSANSYHTNYLTDIKFSNFYITKYFKKIDARRHKHGKHTLLPLKKIEKTFFVDPAQCKLTRKELKQTMGNCIKIFIEMLTATTIILIDQLFYETLDLVRRHSKMEYYQSGIHDMIVNVKGTGMVASMIRSVVEDFNFKRKLNETLSNAECLPVPSSLKTSHLKRIYIMYCILFAMVIFQGYAERLMRFFCASFYPKHEKRRVLFLYNDTLKRRISYFKYKLARVKRKVQENKLSQDGNIVLKLRLKYPGLLGWLIYFDIAKRKCLICGDLESRRQIINDRELHKCPVCSYIFCLECWNDADETCIVCHPKSASDDESIDDGKEDDEIAY